MIALSDGHRLVLENSIGPVVNCMRDGLSNCCPVFAFLT